MKLVALCILVLPVFGQVPSPGPANEPAIAAAVTPSTESASDSGGPAPTLPAPGVSSTAAQPAIYEPFTTGRKFEYATARTFSPEVFVYVGLSAGIDQLENAPSEWHQGAGAYGERFASEFGLNMAHEYFRATLASVLHEDPRYFASGERSSGARIKNVVRQIFITRKDDGTEGFAYDRWISALGAGELANVWMPPSERGFGHGAVRGVEMIGIDAAFNLAQEFIPLLRKMDHTH